MQRGQVRRAFCAPFNFRRLVELGAIAVMAAGLGACSSQMTGRFASMSASPPAGATIAFESIDGPPPPVFSKLVTSLNAEAGTQRIAVVSRNETATYRVRGYVSATVDRNKTSFGWVWDVYDTDKRRALRISGEEQGVTAGGRRDAWTSADDALLRRMAHDGMTKLAAFLDNPESPPAAEPETIPLPTLVAGRSDDSPEAAGIFRLFGGQNGNQDQDNEQATGSVAPEAADDASPAPKPKPAPKPRKRRTAAVAVPATDGRATPR